MEITGMLPDVILHVKISAGLSEKETTILTGLPVKMVKQSWRFFHIFNSS
jgi:hypothetical protein